MNAVGTNHFFTNPAVLTPGERDTITLVETDDISVFELTDGRKSLFFFELATDGDRLDIHPDAWTWMLATESMDALVEEALVHLYVQVRRVKPLLAAPDDYARARGTRRAVSLHRSINAVANLAGRTFVQDGE